MFEFIPEIRSEEKHALLAHIDPHSYIEYQARSHVALYKYGCVVIKPFGAKRHLSHHSWLFLNTGLHLRNVTYLGELAVNCFNHTLYNNNSKT